MRGARYGSNTELMDMHRNSNRTWPRGDHADHVQALLNMSAAYLHAAANYQEDKPTHSDRFRMQSFPCSVKKW